MNGRTEKEKVNERKRTTERKRKIMNNQIRVNKE